MLYFRKETAKNIATRTLTLFASSVSFLPSMIIILLCLFSKIDLKQYHENVKRKLSKIVSYWA